MTAERTGKGDDARQQHQVVLWRDETGRLTERENSIKLRGNTDGILAHVFYSITWSLNVALIAWRGGRSPGHLREMKKVRKK